MLNECNLMKCLRRYDKDSEFCDVINQDNIIKLNDKNCPLYCDKFYCFETEKIITSHEDINWISYGSKNNDGMFRGLSNEGNILCEKKRNFEKKHEYQDTTVCPYCDYEFEGYENKYEEGEHEVNCPYCNKEFIVQTDISIEFSTTATEEE